MSISSVYHFLEGATKFCCYRDIFYQHTHFLQHLLFCMPFLSIILHNLFCVTRLRPLIVSTGFSIAILTVQSAVMPTVRVHRELSNNLTGNWVV